MELPKNAGETEVEIPVSNAKPGTVAVLVHPDGTEEILKDSIPTENGIRLTVDGSATVKIVDNSKDFIDTQNHWAKDEIDFVSARELVNGISATRYAPNATATRAQLWTILARQNDTDLSGGCQLVRKGAAVVQGQGHFRRYAARRRHQPRPDGHHVVAHHGSACGRRCGEL
ncbi:MAG: S-layer homology domain-containing protein [Oscillospiraceae bacterium]